MRPLFRFWDIWRSTSRWGEKVLNIADLLHTITPLGILTCVQPRLNPETLDAMMTTIYLEMGPIAISETMYVGRGADELAAASALTGMSMTCTLEEAASDVEYFDDSQSERTPERRSTRLTTKKEHSEDESKVALVTSNDIMKISAGLSRPVRYSNSHRRMSRERHCRTCWYPQWMPWHSGTNGTQCKAAACDIPTAPVSFSRRAHTRPEDVIDLFVAEAMKQYCKNKTAQDHYWMRPSRRTQIAHRLVDLGLENLVPLFGHIPRTRREEQVTPIGVTEEVVS